MAKAAKMVKGSKRANKGSRSAERAQPVESPSAGVAQADKDRISKWWILAGIIEIGLLGVPARIANSSSTHKNLKGIFVLLFVFALMSIGSSYAGFFWGYWIFFILQIMITAALYLSLRYTDRPFATISLYVMVGLLISAALVVMLGVWYDSGVLVASGTTFSIQPQYLMHVNFTVYNTSVVSGSYTATSPVESIIISQNDYSELSSAQNYTPTFL
jgi:hypothetical protein